MEWLASILTTKIGLVVFVITVVFVVVLLRMAKKGYFSLNTKGLKIGQDIETRLLIEKQFGYVKSKMVEILTEPSIKQYTRTEYKLKYILAEVKDVFERSVVFNNMNTTSAYIESKQIAAYATIIPLLNRDTDDIFFFTQDFKDFVYKKTEEIIKGLVELKENK